jgi:hypothetical protein
MVLDPSYRSAVPGATPTSYRESTHESRSASRFDRGDLFHGLPLGLQVGSGVLCRVQVAASNHCNVCACGDEMDGSSMSKNMRCDRFRKGRHVLSCGIHLRPQSKAEDGGLPGLAVSG